MTAASRTSRERGSASILMVGVIAVALLIAVMLGALAHAAHGHARAQGVADVAALAAAQQGATGAGDPCAVAGTLAAQHGALLTSCVVSGPMVEVRVAVGVNPLPGWRAHADAQARAGPVGLDGWGRRE